MCQTKNSSGVPMLSLLTSSCIAYVCGIDGVQSRGGFKDSKGRLGANIMKDGSADSLHGTGVEENSHPCVKNHYSKGFLHFILRPTHVIILYCTILY